jgi:hypothetical protein
MLAPSFVELDETTTRSLGEQMSAVNSSRTSRGQEAHILKGKMPFPSFVLRASWSLF